MSLARSSSVSENRTDRPCPLDAPPPCRPHRNRCRKEIKASCRGFLRRTAGAKICPPDRTRFASMNRNPFEQFKSNWLVRNGLEMNDSSSKKRQGEPPQEVREESGSPKRKNDAATSVTVELDVLDCPVCLDPLRPPIFQCSVGHIICSTCHGKLINPEKCHYCSSKSDFNRCYGIEKIVESIQVPCSNAKYGCAVKTIYYEKEDHEKTCPHAPCFCPETGCSFARSTRVLLEHFTADHHWRFTKITYGWSFHADVQEGVHILSSCSTSCLSCLAVSCQHSLCSLVTRAKIPVLHVLQLLEE